jgi:hypothetical protein
MRSVRLLVLTWAAGSVTMGTVAAIFLSFPAGTVIAPWSLPSLPDIAVVQPLAGLPFAARLAAAALVAACSSPWRR